VVLSFLPGLNPHFLTSRRLILGSPLLRLPHHSFHSRCLVKGFPVSFLAALRGIPCFPQVLLGPCPLVSFFAVSSQHFALPHRSAVLGNSDVIVYPAFFPFLTGDLPFQNSLVSFSPPPYLLTFGLRPYCLPPLPVLCFLTRRSLRVNLFSGTWSPKSPPPGRLGLLRVTAIVFMQ